jgi:hypothetical protein
VRKAELLYDAANRHLVQIDIEALFDDALEIDATHDAVPGAET